MRTTHSTSTSNTQSRKGFTIQASYVLVALIFLSLWFVSGRQTHAQDSASQSAAQGDTLQIAAREQELRRKEEELLQAMRNAEMAAKPKAAEEIPTQLSAAPESSEPAIEKVSASSENTIAVASDRTEHVNDHRELRALERHPALVTRKTEPPVSRSSQPATIKTHIVEDHPDGTTARRLGTYTRVNRDSDRWQGAPRETSQAHTVTLGDIQREASVRSVSLAHDEVATIRNSSTHLRTGPSRLDTNLLTLPQYSEVSIDYRSGSWYRVKTTRGVRGWVPGNSLLFDAGISPRSAVRIGAVQGKIR